MSKKCSHCQTWKGDNEFYKNAAATNGLHSQCKECRHHGRIRARKTRQAEGSPPRPTIFGNGAQGREELAAETELDYYDTYSRW